MINTAVSLYKRVAEDPNGLPSYELPSFTWILVLVNLILIIPFMLITRYTFQHVYPVFAIVEDENPPAYEPLPLNAVDEDGAPIHKPTGGEAKTVSSSIRSIYRLLKANGGIRANFRGLACFLTQRALTWMVMAIFSGALGGVFTPVATLLAALTLVQYSTAWVHIIISTPSTAHFWRRLPPFKRTFDATWKAVTLYWFANELHSWVPFGIAALMGLDISIPEPGKPTTVPAVNFGQVLLFVVVSIATNIFVLIPAHVVLVRVQASLLPPEVDSIIPFDRSFEGRVEPALVGGRGYVTISDVWATFTKGAWKRLVFLYVKIFALIAGYIVLLMVIIAPQAIVIARHTKKVGDGEL